MVRRGSTVRVRQRALKGSCKSRFRVVPIESWVRSHGGSHPDSTGARTPMVARLGGRRSASKHAKTDLLIDGYLIAYGCESIRERLRHACSTPGTDGLEAP